jgi:hypothetical protein
VSGGHFGYKQYEIQQISEEIEQLIEGNNDKTPDRWGDTKGREYPPAVIAEFHKAVKALKVAQVYVQRVDYLLSGDDGEDSFLRRLAEELGALG